MQVETAPFMRQGYTTKEEALKALATATAARAGGPIGPGGNGGGNTGGVAVTLPGGLAWHHGVPMCTSIGPHDGAAAAA